MCVYGVSVGSFTYKELWRLSMGNFRWVEWTDPGIWSCGWRSWFTSNPQCGPGQPTKHVWSPSACLGKVEGEMARVLWSSPGILQAMRSHLLEDTAAPSASAFARAALSRPRFQPCPPRGWEVNGEAIHPVSRDGSCVSAAAGLIVFEWDPRLGLATLASYFLGTWKSFLCCVHACPWMHAELFDPTLVSISPTVSISTTEVVHVF